MNDKVASVAVERRPLGELRAHPRNPRVHPDPGTEEWEKLRASLARDYFDPLVWNRRNGLLVSGHLRCRLLADLGFTAADVIVVDYDEPMHLARMIAANRLAGKDDRAALAVIVEELHVGAADLALTGLRDVDLAKLLSESESPPAPEPAEPPAVPLTAPEEMAEVHPILPAEILASTPGAICPHVRTRFQKSYEEYAAHLGVGLRTVKRWAALGKKAGDPCPLDDLARLPEWWARHMSYAISASLLAICSGKPTTPASSAAAAAGGLPLNDSNVSGATTDPPSGRHAINVQDLAAIGLKENVERLSKIHRANLELLEKAFGGSSDSELQLRQRNAEKSARMLSDAQRNYEAYQKEHGEFVDLSDVKRELLRVHASMAQSLVSIFVGLGISRDRALSSVDTWFKHLRETRFASGTTPELRPATASAA